MVKNIKKELCLIFLGLSAAPFTFSKMEVCYQIFDSTFIDINYMRAIKITPVLLLKNDFDRSEFLKNVYMFLYDKKTGYSIGSYIPDNIENLKECADFFKCEKTIDLFNLIFFSVQESLELIKTEEMNFKFIVPNYSKNPSIKDFYFERIYYFNTLDDMPGACIDEKPIGHIEKNAYITKGFKHLLNKYEPIWNESFFNILKKWLTKEKSYSFDETFNDAIRLSESFYPKPNILIRNENNEVFIDKYRFQEALTKYFDRDDKRRIIAECIGAINKNQTNGKTYYKLRKAFYDLSEEGRGSDEIELLNQSNILSVYAVMKGKYGNNSLIWGLAEDKVTKDRFHWLTDLKADISVLVNQY